MNPAPPLLCPIDNGGCLEAADEDFLARHPVIEGPSRV